MATSAIGTATTTCSSRADMSSTPRITSARSAMLPSRTERSRPWPPASNPADALKAVNVTGLYVTPGLIDIHAHVLPVPASAARTPAISSLYPDGYTFRVGVTTVADAGCAGWRNFEEFKDRSSIGRRRACWCFSISWATGCAAAGLRTISPIWKSRPRPRWR